MLYSEAMPEEPDEPLTLPDFVVAIVCLVARWMGAGAGRWRLEFEMKDGHLERWYRHEGPSGHAGLERFADRT